MATTVALKRSSRLRSRDHSVKVLSETKRKPTKVITVNENIQKINVSARRLRPRQNKKNYCDDTKLLQKYVPTKQHDSVVILEKLNLDNKKIPVYKTLKSEKSLEEKNDIYDFKFDPNDVREKPKKKKGKLKKKNFNKPGDRMTKNKTRFKKKLELSKIEIQIKESELKKREDMYLNKIEVPKIDTDIHTIKSEKDMNQIGISEVDTNIQTIEEIDSKKNMKAIETSRIEIDVQKAKESVKKSIINEGETSQIQFTDSIIQNIGKTTLEEETFMDQNRKRDMKKPTILSIENADNIVVAKTFSGVKDTVFRPFRPKNIFDNKISGKQPKNILNSSSLMKSLSPITKISNNLDFGSPWRPPTFSMFSQAKHFVQSTPNVSMEINNENLENIEQDKENLKINKKNKHRKNKEKKQKTFTKKHVIPEQVLTNKNLNKIQPSKTVEQSAPSRISLGKIRTLLQEKPDNNEDNKQVMNEVQTEAIKSFETQKEKHLVDYLNFSDTFDVMSETERLSNVDTNVPLFFDLEPSYFSKVFIIKILTHFIIIISLIISSFKIL